MAAERYRTVDDDLDQNHREALDQAVKNVLSTDIALATFAQIIDGLPLSDVAWDTRGTKLTPQHPINLHTQLCPGTLDKARAYRERFSLDLLSFKPEIFHAFGSSPPSSRTFMLRLLELTATAIHQAAVFVFQMKLNLHDPTTTSNISVEDVTNWERPPDDLARVVPYPTLFTQSHFIAYGKYPEGVADMVGYWAEDRILGGVLLFDHSQGWDDETNPEPNAYIHPNRRTATFRICQLLDQQQQRLFDFLREGKHDGSEDEGIPVLPTLENRHRIDQADAIPVHKVYRDIWERADGSHTSRRRKRRDVVREIDYPELTVDAQMRNIHEAESLAREVDPDQNGE